MEIGDEIRATHAELSGVSGRFLDHVLAAAADARPADSSAADLPGWLRHYPFRLQAWPTFVGGAKLEQLRRATVGVTRLVKAIPERIFGNDPRRLAGYYGLDEHAAAGMLAAPTGLPGALARLDFIDGAEGLQCLELNLQAYIGGWQIHFWDAMYRRDPMVARFLAGERLEPVAQDPFANLFRHLLDDAPAGVAAAGALNLALVVDAEHAPGFAGRTRYLNAMYAAFRARDGRGLDGEVVICAHPDGLAPRAGRLCHGELPVHAVLEYTNAATPESVLRCFKEGSIRLYNSPLADVLDDKRNLALLSEHAASDAFTAAERELIRAHVPWSRALAPGRVDHHGEPASLVELLLARRETMVIKSATGARGKDVLLGRFTPPAAWEEAVRRAAAAGGWLAQEHVESRPYLYQHGERGCAPHRVVWGLFCFGDAYGGGFLRMLPLAGNGGVINSARGATEGLFYEV